MDIYFKHYMENNVMAIKDNNIFVNDYKINMIIKNNIRNLLKLNICCINGNVELIYDISGKQSIEQFCLKDKLNYDEIKLIFRSIIDLNSDMDRYLLDINHIILDINYIFIDNNADNIYFCYYVNNDMDFYDGLRKMVQRLAMITNHSDRLAIEYVYGILNICEHDNYLLKDIREYLNSFTDNSTDRKREISIYKNIQKESDSKGDNYNTESYNYKKKMLRKEGVIGTITNIFNSKSKGNIKNTYENEDVNVNYVAEERNTSAEEINKNITYGVRDNVIISEDTVYMENIIDTGNKKLCSISGEQDIIINSYPFIIGKNSEKADGIIKDNSISRIHARIDTINEDCYTIEDLNSKNGTYVNDERLNPYEKVVINTGDKLRFSALEYFFK